MRPGEPVEVGRWTWRWQAEMALEALRAEEIHGVVVADDAGGQYVGIAPARLLVGAENADEARRILAEMEEEPEEEPD